MTFTDYTEYNIEFWAHLMSPPLCIVSRLNGSLLPSVSSSDVFLLTAICFHRQIAIRQRTFHLSTGRKTPTRYFVYCCLKSSTSLSKASKSHFVAAIFFSIARTCFFNPLKSISLYLAPLLLCPELASFWQEVCKYIISQQRANCSLDADFWTALSHSPSAVLCRLHLLTAENMALAQNHLPVIAVSQLTALAWFSVLVNLPIIMPVIATWAFGRFIIFWNRFATKLWSLFIHVADFSKKYLQGSCEDSRAADGICTRMPTMSA